MLGKQWGLGARALGGALSCLLSHGYARAQPVSSQPQPSASNVPPAEQRQDAADPSVQQSVFLPEDTTTHNHDGFLFEASIGGGLLLARVDDPVTGDAKIKTGSLTGGFAIGGTPFRGLAFGLSGLGTAITASSIDREQPRPASDDQSAGCFSYAVFAKYWPDPRGGFQLEAAAGFATLWASENGEPAFGKDNSVAIGPSFGVGVGLQTWMSRQQSVGAMARVVYAPLSGDWNATALLTTLSMIVSIH